MTSEEAKQKIIDRIGELAPQADALTLTSMTTTLGLLVNLENSKEDLIKNSSSSLGILAGLMMGGLNGNAPKSDKKLKKTLKA